MTSSWGVGGGSWTIGQPIGYWGEDPVPSGQFYEYCFVNDDSVLPEHLRLIELLYKFRIIEHGIVYEQAESIRIRKRK